MFIDILLILICIACIGYGVYIVKSKLPHLASVNVHTIPEHKQARIKRQILEDKLRRDLRRRWEDFRNFFSPEKKNIFSKWFSRFYQRLKDLEQEYRFASKKDLSSNVTRARSVEEMLASARQYMANADYNRSEQILIDALKIDEHNIKVYTLLAQVYKAKGDYDHAKETLEYILRLTNAEDPHIYSSLAVIAKERGDMHTAQEDYLKSISLDPNNHNYYIELAQVYAVLGQHDKAKDVAQKALAFASNNPRILDFLIENSIILQDKIRADEYLSKLIEVNPQNGKIASFKERITSLDDDQPESMAEVRGKEHY